MDVSIEKTVNRDAMSNQKVVERVLSHLPYLVILADQAGKVKYANRVALEILGKDNSAVMQRPLIELIPGLGDDKSADEMRIGLATKGRWDGEVMALGPDGQESILELRAILVQIEGESNFLYSGRDVTDLRYRQWQASKNDRSSARGEVAGEISHELNNYLSIIMGNLELLGMGLANGNIDSLAPRIKAMREGLTRITGFVEGLMSMARPGAGYESTDLRKFIEKEVFFIMRNPRYKDIEFLYRWHDDLPPVEVIGHRLQQALVSIFDNARDAMADVPPGGKRITIEGSYSPEADLIKLKICDNGRGMSEENYQKLFRQLFSTKGPGHGFGLLAVKSEIKSQGGRISAAPSADGGACFTIELPRRNTSPTARIAIIPE